MKLIMAVLGVVATLLGGVNPAKEEMPLIEKSVSADVRDKLEVNVSSPEYGKDVLTRSIENTTVEELTDVDVNDGQGGSTNVRNVTEVTRSGVRRNNGHGDDISKSSPGGEDDAINDTLDGPLDKNALDSLDDESLSTKNRSLIPEFNVTKNNETVEDSLVQPIGNDSSSENVTSLPTSTSLPIPTLPPFVFVDPKEFLTDDLDASCPLRRLVDASSSSTSEYDCSALPISCFNCTYDYACAYGAPTSVSCTTSVACRGEKTIERNTTCQYCFQTKFGEEHVCTLRNGPGDAVQSGCSVKKSPLSQSRFQSNCTVRPHVLCLGRRSFPKMLPCNWTSGYRWTTALILSIFLGGFGADRFYLGQWREGIGKLFSFGGLGVWTVIDVILISIGYIGPDDGSLYIY